MRSAEHASAANENISAFKRLKTLYLLCTYLYNQPGLFYSAYICISINTELKCYSAIPFSRASTPPPTPSRPIPLVSPNCMFINNSNYSAFVILLSIPSHSRVRIATESALFEGCIPCSKRGFTVILPIRIHFT